MNMSTSDKIDSVKQQLLSADQSNSDKIDPDFKVTTPGYQPVGAPNQDIDDTFKPAPSSKAQ